MKSLTEIEREIAEEKRKYFENYLYWCRRIKRKAIELLGKDVRVLVFGSAVKGSWGPNSDIDVLIISDKLKENWIENMPTKLAIKKAAGSFSPFQVHLATPEEYRNWWKRFIKMDYKEI
jgi:predicted nucleotidyltransferase